MAKLAVWARAGFPTSIALGGRPLHNGLPAATRAAGPGRPGREPGRRDQGSEGMIKIKGFEHVSVAAADLEPTQGVLGLFGIEPTGREDIPEQDVTTTYYEGPNQVRFEIIRPLGEHSHLHRFLERRGPGLHHICVQVENLEEACAAIRDAGGRIIDEIFSDSRGRHAFVHPKFTGGVLIGMIELHPGLE
jgi:methylmalonyl-CoA/ethylmalonyl-CoA epimerase